MVRLFLLRLKLVSVWMRRWILSRLCLCVRDCVDRPFPQQRTTLKPILRIQFPTEMFAFCAVICRRCGAYLAAAAAAAAATSKTYTTMISGKTFKCTAYLKLRR